MWGNSARLAIDFHEGDRINEAALKDLLRAAVVLNTARPKASKPLAKRKTRTTSKK